jgi:hypothetical protein
MRVASGYDGSDFHLPDHRVNETQGVASILPEKLNVNFVGEAEQHRFCSLCVPKT